MRHVDPGRHHPRLLGWEVGVRAVLRDPAGLGRGAGIRLCSRCVWSCGRGGSCMLSRETDEFGFVSFLVVRFWG